MRYIYSLLVAAVVFSAVSCNKEFDNAEELDYVVSYTATLNDEDVKSKAMLGTSVNNKPQSMWESGDQITIHNGNKEFIFKTNQSGTASALFGYTGTDFTPVDEVIAVYPAGTYSVDMAAKKITATIPTDQEGRTGQYNKSAALAVAYSTTGELAFKNACALLKFKVGTDNMKSVTISGNNGEKISGEVVVCLNEAGTVESVQSTNNSKEYVQVWKHDNSLMKKGEVYYVAIIPQTFTYGLKAEAQNNNMSESKYRVKETVANYSVEKNTIVDLGTISHNTSAKIGTGWMLPGGYNSWATSTSNGSTRYFYTDGDFYVVKNVKIMNTVSGQDAGFKVTNGTNWYGTNSTSNFALNTWHDLGNGDKNIKVASNKSYDVYITQDFKKVYITETGTPISYKMLYMNAGEWNDDSKAWFQAWTWSNENDGKWETFYNINGDEYATIIRKTVTSVKLLRKGPEHASNQWQSWNETANITLNSKNYLKFTGWSTFSLNNK